MKKAFELVSSKKGKQSSSLQMPIGDGALAGEEDYIKKIKRFNIVQIIRKICNLKISEDLNE